MIYDVAATEDVAADVHRLADGSAGLLRLITPEGELGRLGDNLFRPTFVAALPNRMLVEFEDRLAVSGRVTGFRPEALCATGSVLNSGPRSKSR